MMKFYSLPESISKEIEEYGKMVKEFLAGNIHPVKFKAFRVPFGVYEQRKENTYMTRIRCAAGCITPLQLGKSAATAEKYGSGVLHVTTRQELQIHNVGLEDTVKVMEELLKVGLSTRGGGGNTVRNIMASHDSGVKAEEVFDVAPHASALTSRLISEKDSWSLPRKFKISFSSGPGDTANATVQDLGFIAALKHGEPGFSVYAAGGMGAKASPGILLFQFIPENRVYNVVTAAKRLFDKKGNRKNKHRARLRYLLNDLGQDEFMRLFFLELDNIECDSPADFTTEPIDNSSQISDEAETSTVPDEEFELWKRRYVFQQKQEGLVQIKIPLRNGDISSTDAALIADTLALFGENTLRFSMDQNIYLRNIPESHTRYIYSKIVSGISSLSEATPLAGNIIACTGAGVCKLGLCLSRELQKELYSGISAQRSFDDLKDFKIHISGCPNSCGQHHVADLGFFGRPGRKDGRVYPAYSVLAGASLKPGETKLAEQSGTLAARDVPEFINRLLSVYSKAKNQHKSFSEYIEGPGRQKLKEILSEFENVPSFEEDKNYYFDWGDDTVFSVAKLSDGECSAGLFDMIDIDLKSIEKQKKRVLNSESKDEINEALYEIALASSRMLLVTKGIEAESDRDVYEAFLRTFISPGLVSSDYAELISSLGKNGQIELQPRKDLIFQLALDIESLYNSMDNSLRFPGEEEASAEASKTETQSRTQAARFKDLRGVLCPLNFVKTKIELSTLKEGDVLEILLDEGEPINNVPLSVQAEGHTILHQTKIDDYWAVQIQKG